METHEEPTQNHTKRRSSAKRLISLGALFGVAAIVGLVVSYRSQHQQVAAPAQTSGTLVAGADSYKYAGKKIILRNMYAGTVTVQPATGSGQIGIQRGGASGKDFKLTAVLQNGSFVLGQTGQCSSPCTALFTIGIPKGVEVELAGGAAKFNLDRLPANVTADVAGPIQAHGLTGNRVGLRSQDGSIQGSELQVGALSARTAKGAISLQLSTAPNGVSAEADDGNVAVQLPNSPDGYSVTTKGDTAQPQVSGKSNAASQHKVSAISHNGQVTVNLP